jgi:uncharacterized sulfatase
MKKRLALLLLGLSSLLAAAEFDYALQAQPVGNGVYAFFGRTEDFDTKNGGNIVNTACIVAPEGLIVIDSGPSRRYGEQMRQAMQSLSRQPIALVINTHHHPDHFLGNQAFADRPLAALPGTTQGIQREGNAFAENLYRMSGDWLKGTEVQAPTQALQAGLQLIAGRPLRLLALDGHSGADLAIFDESSGVLLAGDLVFNGRAPTTPHADIAHWLQALDQLEAITREAGFRALLPGHGALARNAAPIQQTRAWLRWLQTSMQQAAAAGLDMNEVLARPLPAEFADMPLAASEYRRSVGHLFPAAEQAALSEGH